MSELQSAEIKKRCSACNVPSDYLSGNILLEQARKKCSCCHFGDLRLYKFDILMCFLELQNKNRKYQIGKRETYSKRYGASILKLKSEGKTIRQIADILNISPTSVTKVIKLLNNSE